MDTQYHSHMAHNQVSGKTILLATLSAIAVGGPLLAMMGFSFLSTMTLFIFTSPLLIIFSPLLLGAGFVLVLALVGFGAAALMAIAGLSALGWVLRSVKEHEFLGLGTATEKLMESAENVKDTGKEWAGNLKQTVQNSPENMTANSA
ncbi:hypothetical protein LXL04_016121 [Taraxacum kok-saghyz]